MVNILSAIREDPPAATSFLPVVYAILDPARVPEKHWHDASSNNDAVVLGMAFSIINIIPTFPKLPVAVLEALWPRVWLWVQLIEEYHLLIHNWVGRTDFVMLRLFVSLWPFLEVEPLKPVVHSTPGTHAFVSRSWPHLPLSELQQTNAMTTFFQFIGHCGSACGVHGAKEFIEGFGEDPSVLAALIVRHITAVAAACRNPKSTVPRALLLGRLHKLSVHIRMLDTLPYLPAGIVKAQTVAMCNLSSFPDAEDTLSGSFLQLSAFLVYSTGYGHLPEALRAGILNSIVSYGADYQRTAGSAFIFGHFLTAVLPASLAYYRVVSAMVSAFARISAKPYKPGFVASAIYPAWTNFVGIVQARLRVLEYFLSKDYVRTRACDNLECGMIRTSAEFQRCGGCKGPPRSRVRIFIHKGNRFSGHTSEAKHTHRKECQILDWKRGGHREACKVFDPPEEIEFIRKNLPRNFLLFFKKVSCRLKFFAIFAIFMKVSRCEEKVAGKLYLNAGNSSTGGVSHACARWTTPAQHRAATPKRSSESSERCARHWHACVLCSSTPLHASPRSLFTNTTRCLAPVGLTSVLQTSIVPYALSVYFPLVALLLIQQGRSSASTAWMVFLMLTKRGDAFLRLILHRDYQAHKFDTLMQQLTYLASNPGRRDFCTTFNYSSGHCVISVGPVDSTGSGFTERQIAAALSASSRLALHRVILKRGNLDVVRPYVLRSSSPALAMGLEEIRTAIEKTEDMEEARRMLHVLCEAEVLETHG
ncbi:hypothetical protein C8R47DRAFT_1085267 [Mycena vitilis]|nr:hypothetical protein C8R47DRAFT_1085267 [Mycena vitilis]